MGPHEVLALQQLRRRPGEHDLAGREHVPAVGDRQAMTAFCSTISTATPDSWTSLMILKFCCTRRYRAKFDFVLLIKSLSLEPRNPQLLVIRLARAACMATSGRR
jgi:hypothetical protein